VSPPILVVPRISPAYHRCKKRVCGCYARYKQACTNRLEAFVLCGEEFSEATRLRRRLHIHVCLLGVAGLLTFLGAVSFVDADMVVGISVGLNSVQEFLDYVGRF